MKVVKVSLLVFLAAIMVFLTACQQQSKTQPSSASTGGNADGKKATIKFWYPGQEPFIVDAVKGLIADFEKENPNIKVDYSPIPWAEYFQKLSVSYAGGIAPDVHGLGHGQLISTVDQGKYMDLNKFINADNWDGKQDMLPSALEAGKWKDGQYGLIMPVTRPIVWRKDYFQEAGLDPNTPPKTVDELFEFAEKLKKVENGKTVRGGIDIQTVNGEPSFLSLLLLEGGQIYDANGNPTFDSPESVKLLTKLVELYKDGTILPSNYQQLNGLPFTNGLAAMAFPNPSDIQPLIKSVGSDKLGWALPPKGASGKQTVLMLGNFITMSKASKYPEESWKFMKFMFSKEKLLKFTTDIGLMPMRKSLQEEFVKLSPQNKVLIDVANDTGGYLPSPDWDKNIKYLRLALEEAFNGLKKPEDALKSNANKVREEMKAKK